MNHPLVVAVTFSYATLQGGVHRRACKSVAGRDVCDCAATSGLHYGQLQRSPLPQITHIQHILSTLLHFCRLLMLPSDSISTAAYLAHHSKPT